MKFLTTTAMTRASATGTTTAYPDKKMYVGVLNNNGTLEQPWEGKVSAYAFCLATISGNFTISDAVYKKTRANLIAKQYGLYSKV
jgi:hypothetical protein